MRAVCLAGMGQIIRIEFQEGRSPNRSQGGADSDPPDRGKPMKMSFAQLIDSSWTWAIRRSPLLVELRQIRIELYG